MAHGRTLTAADGVIYNDNDADDDTLAATLVTDVEHGTLTPQSRWDLYLHPGRRLHGTDSFSYSVSDGLLTSNAATVTITVTERVPDASADIYTVAQGQTLTIAPASQGASGVLFNDNDADGDTLTAVLVSARSTGR